jgi:hypothetical protein
MKRLKDLKNGDIVKFGRLYGKPITWLVGDQNHEGFPSDSTTLVAAQILKLMPFDAKEPENEQGNREDWGNNRYLYSNIRQWLNSKETQGKWFEKQHKNDEPPSESFVSCNPYFSEAGFLSLFTNEEQAMILETEITTVIPDIDGGGGDRAKDKFFLLSAEEAGLSADNAEGYKLALFSDDKRRVALLSPESVEHSDYKHDAIKVGEPWYYWLRTPYAAGSSGVRRVGTDGALGSGSACHGSSGLRPACNLSSSLLVSDFPDSAGAYCIVTGDNEKEAEMVVTLENATRDLADLKINIQGKGCEFQLELRFKLEE